MKRILMMLIVLTVAGTTVLTAQGSGNGHRHGQRGNGWFQSLTEAQKTEVQALVESMWVEGADREAIHRAVRDLVSSWGIEIPERPGRGGREPGFMRELSEELRTELRELIRSMRLAGEDRKAIHEAIRNFFIEHGLTPPDLPDGRWRRTDRAKRIKASNFPNPFNPSTTISYTLEETSPVSITIMDVTGKTVRAYAVGEKSPGTHSISWNGRTEDGVTAASGLYFYQVNTGNDILTKSMLLLK